MEADHGAAEQVGVLATSPELSEYSNSKEIQVTLQGSCLMMFQNKLMSKMKNQSSEYVR